MTAVRPLKGKYDDNVESKDTLQSLVQSCCCGGARKYSFQSPLDDVQECKHHHHLPEQKEPIFDQNVRNLRDYYLMSLKKSSSNSISLSHVSPGVSKEAMHVKTRIRWTEDLHKKFMECVDRLGGPKKATPKAILKLMNCNGLTIFHIKSHLQKHRVARLTQDESEGNAEQLNAKTGMQIVEALRLQMDVQRHLFEQLESQKKLQLRIEEQGKQLQTMLQCQMNTK